MRVGGCNEGGEMKGVMRGEMRGDTVRGDTMRAHAAEITGAIILVDCALGGE